jgi:hypothetical protein
MSPRRPARMAAGYPVGPRLIFSGRPSGGRPIGSTPAPKGSSRPTSSRMGGPAVVDQAPEVFQRCRRLGAVPVEVDEDEPDQTIISKGLDRLEKIANISNSPALFARAGARLLYPAAPRLAPRRRELKH